MKKFMTIFCAILVGSLGIFLPIKSTQATEISEKIPEIYIKAISPGFTKDGKSNVGEMIEIARKNADAPISLAGAAVSYTNSSGNESVLLEFPENSWLHGENILLRLASSPGSDLANEKYTKTLAMSGALALSIDGEVVDRVCWTGKDGCAATFKSASPTTLVRNLETGEWEHLEDYQPTYKVENYHVETSKDEAEARSSRPSQCKGVEFSEILSYYDTSKEEQFIELFNPTAGQILLDGCQIRYKSKNYLLMGVVQPESYFVYYPKEFSLTKNPTNSNTLELIDVNDTVVDKLTYPNGQRKGTAYALIGYDGGGEEIWKVTYAPTPGEANNYQEFKTCEEGKVLNKATGNCVKKTSLKTTVCKDGYFLNVLTGRCNKIKTAAAKTCKDGYELNPETNRCRKIKENNGADYSLEPENYTEQTSFIALYAVLGVLGVGAIYLIYEFRHEILKLWRRVFRRFH